MSAGLSARPEEPAVFECSGDRLVGVVHPSAAAASIGVVVVVGGPQYRVGSHRQFVNTARAVAAAGYPVLRFDYRGMGDSEGEPRAFDEISEDIRAAVDYLCSSQSVAGVVLYGLCDAASASLIYCSTDARVRGVIAVNPWVRTEEGEARSYLRHYYLQRIFARSFWRKLLSGEFAFWQSVRGLWANWRASRRQGQAAGGAVLSFIDRMRLGLAEFAGDALFLISGKDLTAQEFVDYCARSKPWTASMARSNVDLHRLPNADHTFSARAELESANLLCLDWLRQRWPPVSAQPPASGRP